MPDSPTKLGRTGSLSHLDSKEQTPNMKEESKINQVQESIMQLRPLFDFSKIMISKAQPVPSQQQKLDESVQPKKVETPSENIQCQEIKTPVHGLMTTSPTMNFDIQSPIQLEPDHVPKLVEGKDIIGDYKIGKLLGTGAYGAVKLGEHLTTGQKVAIKIIHKRKQKSERAQTRIAREISNLKQLKHPNVMECYGVIETDKTWFIITEFCTKGELFDYVQRQETLPESEAVEFFDQILNGVEYFHQMGICHRDLKLENILLDDDKNVKIADFGMSRKFEEGETMKTRCGSPHYMPPEIVMKGCQYDPIKADIYSLGVVLFGMVNGFLPFDGENDAELFENIQKGKFEMAEDITFSDECENLIRRMMEPNPENRITLSEVREHVLMRGQKKEIAISIEEL